MTHFVCAELVANVLEISVGRGTQVDAVDMLVLLESMKMEIPVLTEIAGTVASIEVSMGDVVQGGTLIAVLEPAVEAAG